MNLEVRRFETSFKKDDTLPSGSEGFGYGRFEFFSLFQSFFWQLHTALIMADRTNQNVFRNQWAFGQSDVALLIEQTIENELKIF